MLLMAWNLFTDLAASVNGEFDPECQQTQQIYEKLFWGNHLPAVTPPDNHSTPLWSDEELLLIRDVLARGLALFRKHVVIQT